MSRSSPDVFAPARAIADAVLYEGYVLYPYRASADKNRIRWQWGIVGPPGAGTVGEAPTMGADLVVECSNRTSVRLRLRFLQVVRRQVERVAADDTITRVESVTIPRTDGDDETHVSFDDSINRAVELFASVDLGGEEHATSVDFSFEAHSEHEPLGEVDGHTYRLTRRTERLTGRLDCVLRRTVGDGGIRVVEVRVHNTTGWPGAGTRDDATIRSLVGAHVLGAVDGGWFVSTLDPPPELAGHAAGRTTDRLWPVLIGAERRAPLVLASPVILYDQPEIAPESRGSFFDGLEIDEMLVFRVRTMTDAEKAEARATDPRAAAVIDRVDAMPDDELATLHGTIRQPDGRPPSDPFAGDEVPLFTTPDGGPARNTEADAAPWWNPAVDEGFDPDTDEVVAGGRRIARGSSVRLHPNRRADAHDLFLRDRVATVRAVVHDVDGSVHVAVTVDDDPAADINDQTGRFLYFAPDEIEPLDPADNGPTTGQGPR